MSWTSDLQFPWPAGEPTNFRPRTKIEKKLPKNRIWTPKKNEGPYFSKTYSSAFFLLYFGARPEIGSLAGQGCKTSDFHMTTSWEALTIHFANVHFAFQVRGGPLWRVRARVVFSGDFLGKGTFKEIKGVRGAPLGSKNQSGHVKSGLQWPPEQGMSGFGARNPKASEENPGGPHGPSNLDRLKHGSKSGPQKHASQRRDNTLYAFFSARKSGNFLLGDNF